MKIISDKILLKPEDIKPKYKNTKIIGVFNPALTKINNKIIIIARISEEFKNKKYISWLLPIELDNNLEIKKIYYKKAILPKGKLQEFGVEDPRITKINNKYYMTVVGYNSKGINTFLYQLNKNLTTKNLGIIFDHKDIVLFPQKDYIALTRKDQKHIGIAYSKDLKKWENKGNLISINSHKKINLRIGAGPPLIKIKDKWLVLIHGVEKGDIKKGYYKTYSLILNKNLKIIKGPTLILKAKFKIKNPYLKKDIVFTTGMIKYKNHYLLASGELDTALRLTEIDIKV